LDGLWWLSLIALPLLGLVGIMLFAAWLTRQVTDRAVGRTHRWIEEIMNSGEPPQAWARRAAWPTLTRDSRERSGLEKAKASYLRRLDGLIAYAETSPLMGDEETKEVVLQRLDEIYDDWAERNPAAFRPTDGAAPASSRSQ
jgi:hypothetical protein